jgi:hypothetical protein
MNEHHQGLVPPLRNSLYEKRNCHAKGLFFKGLRVESLTGDPRVIDAAAMGVGKRSGPRGKWKDRLMPLDCVEVGADQSMLGTRVSFSLRVNQEIAMAASPDVSRAREFDLVRSNKFGKPQQLQANGACSWMLHHFLAARPFRARGLNPL